MRLLKIPLLLILLNILPLGCQHNSSIEGLWISEITSRFEPGADKAAFLIRRDSTQILKARGVFLKNNELVMEWKCVRISIYFEDLEGFYCPPAFTNVRHRTLTLKKI